MPYYMLVCRTENEVEHRLINADSAEDAVRHMRAREPGMQIEKQFHWWDDGSVQTSKKLFPVIRAIPTGRDFRFSELELSNKITGSQIRKLSNEGWIQLVQRYRAQGSVWRATRKLVNFVGDDTYEKLYTIQR